MIYSDFSELSSAPLYFPVYAENKNELIRFLFDNGIYTMLYKCPSRIEDELQGTIDGYIFKHIVFLPCDQRYSQKEMQYICDRIKAFDSAKEDAR